MFSPLVASHFICDFLAFEQGLFCPIGMLTVSHQMYTPEIFSCQRKDEFSIFLCKLYFGLSCFLSVKILGDAKLERAYFSAACALVLERNGAPNVFLCWSVSPLHEKSIEFECVRVNTPEE